MLATLGSVVFEASADLVRTFSEFSLKSGARWAAHEVIGQRPVQEYIGPALRTLSLAIRLDLNLGVDPEAEADSLRAEVEAGTILPLMIGGAARGDWIARDMTETWRQIGQDGTVGVIDLALSLEEYA
jgi:hypothetical protein